MDFHLIFQSLLNSFQYAAVLSLSAFAIILIFKTSTTTNFAQGTISVFGAFLTAYLYTNFHFQILLALAIGVVASFLFGYLVDTQIFRRSRRLTGIGKQMITMGIVLFTVGLMPVIFGNIDLNIAPLITGVTSFHLLGITEAFTITNQALLTTVLAILIIGGLFVTLKFTKWGLGVRATASSEPVAGLMGVNTHSITAMSWSIAGGIGALAAILYGPALGGTVSPSFMNGIQVNGFMASVLGGFGTFYGPIVGSWLIAISNNMLGISYPGIKDIILYVLILVVVLIRPIGLFGKKAIKKV
ncbi:MAG: branched-chain amino acid ABC transporter permease [Firmicutes bacterium]|nr:branched-chain amino acid ABC transporter permease [Bacillota bacterium]